jgi:hypothetical protein
MINLANMEEVQAIINDKSLDFVGVKKKIETLHPDYIVFRTPTGVSVQHKDEVSIDW